MVVVMVVVVVVGVWVEFEARDRMLNSYIDEKRRGEERSKLQWMASFE